MRNSRASWICVSSGSGISIVRSIVSAAASIAGPSSRARATGSMRGGRAATVLMGVLSGRARQAAAGAFEIDRGAHQERTETIGFFRRVLLAFAGRRECGENVLALGTEVGRLTSGHHLAQAERGLAPASRADRDQVVVGDRRGAVERGVEDVAQRDCAALLHPALARLAGNGVEQPQELFAQP